MLKARFEFKLADLWVGAFWRRSTFCTIACAGPLAGQMTETPQVEAWVCLLPCVPLHILWRGEAKQGYGISAPAAKA